LVEDAAEPKDWAEVNRVIEARMKALNMSTAHLARETGLSPTTIRYVGGDGGSESPLVAIAAVLGWKYDYLRNILHGKPEKNALESSESIAERRFRETLHKQLAPVKKGIAALQVRVDKMDRMIGGSTPPDDGAAGSA
jgi:hypothetical protein